MSLTTIEDLPKDVLLDIFDYLDGSTLKVCAKVCKQWNDLIGSSSSTMKKLPLILRFSWIDLIDEVKSLQRKHYTILLDSFSFTANVEIPGNIGSHVRRLEMDNIQIESTGFSKFLDLLPMLEKATISDCRFHPSPDFPNVVKKTSLKKLKSLVMIESEFKMFKFFTKSETKVGELKLLSTSWFYGNEGKNFQDFLKVQTDPMNLALRVVDGGLLRSLVKFENKYKLKNLGITYKGWPEDEEEEKDFIKLLDIHRETLENLEAEKPLTENIIQHIMKTLKLKRLIISVDEMLNNPCSSSLIHPNSHLKTLIIEGDMHHWEVVRGLLKVYTSIEKLAIRAKEADMSNILTFITANLKRLTHLHIPKLSGAAPPAVIPTLKTFHIEFIDDVDAWQAFLVNNPSLETISCKWIQADAFSYETLDTITQRLPNLRHIKFGPMFCPAQRTLEMLHRNCPKLTLMETFNMENLTEGMSTNIGNLNLIVYSHATSRNVFKDELNMWTGENLFSEDLEDMNVDYDDDDDNDFSFDDDDDDDFNGHESDFDYMDEDAFPDDDGYQLFGMPFV